ncbi:hypothetical protein RvY_06911 [Ramazzottius varieornatus]|uniref:Uncharacterized protein n=1 Tax=Ramazzottius varieornatus TaxID=947166 RepID=A0A1D1V3H8_RAMVA|nr:hypothetical protein RvY_06911 [Ramazzottius varieornatus]
MELPSTGRTEEKSGDVADKKSTAASQSDSALEVATKSIPSTSILPLKTSDASCPPSGSPDELTAPNAPSTAPVDPYAFPREEVYEKITAGGNSSKTSLPVLPAKLSDVKPRLAGKTAEPTVSSPKPSSLKPALLNTLSQIKLTEDFESITTPLGSPITPDVGEAFHPSLVKNLEVEGGPKKFSLNKAEGATPESVTKRKPSRELPAPGSPLSVVSERQQLALLRKEALESEKRSSPDTTFPRPDRSSTPSSTSSAKESREARSVNRRDGKGETPLHVASKKGDLEAAKKLVDDGADVNAADNAGWTPLHEAANHGREDVCRFLISAGAELNAKGMGDVTPLMDAIINGHLNIAKELMNAGANPAAINNRGENCLKLAEEATKNQPELTELLQRHIGPLPSLRYYSSSTSGPVLKQAPAKKKKETMPTTGKEGKEVTSPKKRVRQLSESEQRGKKADKDKGTKKKMVEGRDQDNHTNRPISTDKETKDKTAESEKKEKLSTEERNFQRKKLKGETVSTSAALGNFAPGVPAIFVGRNTLVLKPADPVVEKEKVKVKENATASQYEDISDEEEATPPEAPSATQMTPTQSQSFQASTLISASLNAPMKETVPSVSAAAVLSHPPPTISNPMLVTPAKKGGSSATSGTNEPVDGMADEMGKLGEPKDSKNVKEKEKKESVPAVEVPTAESSAGSPPETVPPPPTAPMNAEKIEEAADIVAEKQTEGATEKDEEPENGAVSARDSGSGEVSTAKQPTLQSHPTSPTILREGAKPAADPTEKKVEKSDISKDIPLPPSSSTTLTLKPQVPAATNPSPNTAPLQTPLVPPPTHTTSTLPVTEKPAVVSAGTHEAVPPHQSQPSVPPLPLSQVPKEPATAEQTSSTPTIPTVTTSMASLPPVTNGTATVTASMTNVPPVVVVTITAITATSAASVTVPAGGTSVSVSSPPIVTAMTSGTVTTSSSMLGAPSVSGVSVAAPVMVGRLSGGPMASIVRMPNVPTSAFVSAMSTSGTKVLFGVSTEKKQDKKAEKTKNKETKKEEKDKEKVKVKEGKDSRENVDTTPKNEQAAFSWSNVKVVKGGGDVAGEEGETSQPKGKKRGESATKKERAEKPEKRLTRAQRAAAAAASGQPITPTRRKNAKEDKDKPTRGRGKRAAAETEVPPGAVIDTAEQKQKRPRASPKKQLAMEAAAKSPTKKEETVVVKETPQLESPSKSVGIPVDISMGSSSSEPLNRLPFKKRLTIRNEIEEFINQRRQVEENWKKYTNTFAMKVFPKNCNDYLILRQNYSIDSSMPPKREAPPVLPLALKTCFDEQEEERRSLMRNHLMERDRLIMGAEQEMWRLHQRFSRISAGIPIPFSACMIMSEQESNRSFQSQEQEDRAKTSPERRLDLIKWLEESDDKFDSAKTEMLTRQRLEAQMLHSKQRIYWAWRQEDLGMHDPSCRNPEDLHNPYVPQVVVEDFVMLPDA